MYVHWLGDVGYCHGYDHMVVEFTSTHTNIAYHRFPPGCTVSSANKRYLANFPFVLLNIFMQ